MLLYNGMMYRDWEHIHFLVLSFLGRLEKLWGKILEETELHVEQNVQEP